MSSKSLGSQYTCDLCGKIEMNEKPKDWSTFMIEDSSLGNIYAHACHHCYPRNIMDRSQKTNNLLDLFKRLFKNGFFK